MKPLLLAALLLAPPLAASADDVKAHPSCSYCGMDREKFGHSRMLVEYEDGKSVGVCSLHCMAVELALTIDRTPVAVRVADLGTRQLVDAERAFWVVGGSRPGVMTGRAKWAFADRAAAQAFVKEHGGEIVAFEDAMRAAYEDMYKDTKAIRERRKMMRTKAAEQPHRH